MKEFHLKKINYVLRIFEDDRQKFRFDILFRSDLVITDGKEYDSITSCLDALTTSVHEVSNLENGFHSLVMNDVAKIHYPFDSSEN